MAEEDDNGGQGKPDPAPEPADPASNVEPVGTDVPPVTSPDPASSGGSSATGDLGTPIYFGAARATDSSVASGSDQYNPEKSQDRTRTWIAIALLAITGAIIFGAFVMAAWALSPDESLENNLKTILGLLNVIFGPIIALLGSVIGFYFGARSSTATGRPAAGGGGSGGGGTTS